MPGLPPGGSRRKAHEARCKQYPGRLPVYSDFRASARPRPAVMGASGIGARAGFGTVVGTAYCLPTVEPIPGWERKALPSKALLAFPPSFPPCHFQVGVRVGAEVLAGQGFQGIPTLPTLKSRCTREKSFFTRCLMMLPTCRWQNFFDVRLWSRGFWVGGVGGRSNPCWARLSAPIRPPTLFFSGGMGGSPRLAVASRFQTWGAARPPTRCRPWPPAMGWARTQKSRAWPGCDTAANAIPAKMSPHLGII